MYHTFTIFTCFNNILLIRTKRCVNGNDNNNITTI